jgi:hypothetical protein
MSNLNFLQKIAIKWYQTFDTTGLIFSMLQQLNIYMRLAFYAGLPLFTLFALSYLSGFLPLHKYGLTSLYNFITYATAIGASIVVFYESIFSLDIKAIIAQKKEEKQRIKREKLQFWRLRNMNIFVRILIYILIYFFIVNFLQITAIAAFFNTYANPTLQDIQMLEKSFNELLKWVSISYIFSFLTLEFFVQKIRKGRQNA